MAADPAIFCALFRALPRLAKAVPWAPLGVFPTPVQPLDGVARDLWVKRDDLSGPRYGGNKVRTLEALFGQAQAAGARRIWATGAVGSNHALATVLYARDAGLEPGVMLFPQPASACSRENLVATLGQKPLVRALWSWASVPFAVVAERRRPGSYVMLPGGATPEGALGYVSAALEVAGQIAAGELPPIRRVVVGVGSTCTSAGLAAGFFIAARLGLLDAAPLVVGVRVTPWPVTSAFRVVGLAARTAALVAGLAGDPRLAASRADLAAGVRVVGGFIGRGYGHPTAAGIEAAGIFSAAGGPPLDTCYSGKAGAGLLSPKHGLTDGPTLFWATKSSRPLPAAGVDTPPAPRLEKWLAKPISS